MNNNSLQQKRKERQKTFEEKLREAGINKLCLRCVNSCKQRSYITIVKCPMFINKNEVN